VSNATISEAANVDKKTAEAYDRLLEHEEIRHPSLFNVREKNGRHEVDLLAEFGVGRVVAVEVKATAAPNRGDAARLEWIRDRLGERFLAGVVFHTGPSAFALTDQIAALPIAALWSAGEAT